MADITKDTVKKLAKLSSIGLSDNEIEAMTTELTAIVGFVEELQSVDIDGVEPTFQVTGLQDAFRADEVNPVTLSREELLINAPAQQDGYIKVPRVL
jgi:aspartyl-tRNA(Asn)/glutamyl-tRNA(Gln) amidotransferase subunit C